jgi:membrane protease YdiL (CAAX protease family)
MQANQKGFFGTLMVVFITLLITVSLGELYVFIIDTLHMTPWKAVVLAHTLVAAGLYLLSRAVRSALRFDGTSYLAWLPAITVLVGSMVLALSSQRGGPSYSVTGSSELIYVISTLTVIPIFEEIVFRAGVTPILDHFAGPVWSVWFSALAFSFAHTQPTFERLINLKVGFLLGPFLLGICCDMIVRRWGKLWPAIAFHSACNATVYIFSTWNPAWLSRLNGLYM